MEKYGYVYLTTNLVNGMVYIGMSEGVFKPTYLGSGMYLKRAVKAYGKENFRVTILEFSMSKDDLNSLEKYYISHGRECLGRDMMYNVSDGGDGGYIQGSGSTNHKIGCKCHSCMARRGEKYNLSKEHKEKIGVSSTGRTHICSDRAKKLYKRLYSGDGSQFYNTRYVHNIELGEEKRVKQEEIQSYIDRGWNLKRLPNSKVNQHT